MVMKTKSLIGILALIAFLACNPIPKNNELKESRTKHEIKPASCTSQSEQNYYQTSDISTPGVLQINIDSLQKLENEIIISNTDGSVYGKIVRNIGANSETILQLFENSKTVDIRAYYPEFNIIHFDCFGQKDNIFEIIINGKKKHIQNRSNLTMYLDWGEYLGSWLVSTTTDNPIKANPVSHSKANQWIDYEMIAFSVIGIEGEWIKVEIDTVCSTIWAIEADQRFTNGWLRWKEGKKLMVSLFYSC